MLLDFANRAFEHDIALRVITPLKGPLVQILKNIGVPTEVVPAPELMLKGSDQVKRISSFPPAAAGLWRWARILRKHEFIRDADVAYSTSFKAHLALAIARRHPVVWHLHEFPPEGMSRMWSWLAGRVPEAVVANSHVVGEAWKKQGAGSGKRGAADRFVVIPNGINLDRFKPAARTFWIHERLGIPRDHKIIGMPSVLARWKGQMEVIKAFGEIADEFQDVHLVIVGGSIYDTLAERAYAKELSVEVDRAATGEWQVVTMGSGDPAVNVERGAGGGEPAAEPPRSLLPRVHMLPFQSKIENTYPEFDLAVHYSTRPEPFGRVVVEAMACGIPVVAANEAGPIEILGGGIGQRREAGWLAEPRDPAALAQTLRSALNLPTEVMHSIGEAGRRRAEDYYSWRRFAADVAGVLKGAAGR
jgi:glycosyltransferase involved in cell wall biosynthesis